MSNSNISDKFQVPEMNDTWTEKSEKKTLILLTANLCIMNNLKTTDLNLEL